MTPENTLRMLVDFAFEQGFHEMGYDVVGDALAAERAEARTRALEDAARLCEALAKDGPRNHDDYTSATAENLAERIRGLMR